MSSTKRTKLATVRKPCLVFQFNTSKQTLQCTCLPVLGMRIFFFTNLTYLQLFYLDSQQKNRFEIPNIPNVGSLKQKYILN